jgi:hypothetical protein
MDKVCTKCRSTKPSSDFYGDVYWCKSCAREYQRNYRSKSSKFKEHNARYMREYGKRESSRAYRREYQKSDKFKKARNLSRQRRVVNDPVFKIKERLRSVVRTSFYRGQIAKSGRYVTILGADDTTVYNHLIQTAIRTYGKYFPGRKYHIDHIIPCSTAKTPEELVRLNHYTNLQLLYPKDNLIKSDKLDYCIKTNHSHKQ